MANRQTAEIHLRGFLLGIAMIFSASIAMSVLLPIPLTTTFGILFAMLTFDLITSIGSGAAVKTLTEATKTTWNIIVGSLVYIALRVVIGEWTNFPVAHFLQAANHGGLMEGVILRHSINPAIIFEIAFAVIVGRLVVSWRSGSHRFISRVIVIGVFLIALLTSIYGHLFPMNTELWGTSRTNDAMCAQEGGLAKCFWNHGWPWIKEVTPVPTGFLSGSARASAGERIRLICLSPGETYGAGISMMRGQRRMAVVVPPGCRTRSVALPAGASFVNFNPSGVVHEFEIFKTGEPVDIRDSPGLRNVRTSSEVPTEVAFATEGEEAVEVVITVSYY